MPSSTLMTVYDANGVKRGEVKFDGRMFVDNADVYDATGRKRGEISWAGQAFDIYGVEHGMTSRNGSFKGGRVESDGTVYDDRNVERGRVSKDAYRDLRMAGAAALLLLFQ
jgi:hypothetical protein